ncbi:P4H10 [Symbiodinium necroappetens]|uniref:P4H10 protein n=1 Tax=Symbiodinium necroappetens TaxID=1628268 RepID=A0A812IM12_9DINO|nr:P4H10 [Symbiodinium necroappetens]
MILVFEGGVFVWPGVEVGFRRNVTIEPRAWPFVMAQEVRAAQSGDRDTQLGKDKSHVVAKGSLQPLVLEISSFLNDADCQHVIDKALPHVERSSVKHMDHDVGKPDANWRTSSTYFMQSDDDTLHRLDDRVSALTLIKKSHQEYSQILRYESLGSTCAHHDYFDPAMYKNNRNIQDMIKKGLYNRLATVFFYLSDVEEGGQTNFPRAGGRRQPRDFADCSKGVSVFPRRGRIIIFYSMHPSGEMDEACRHSVGGPGSLNFAQIRHVYAACAAAEAPTRSCSSATELRQAATCHNTVCEATRKLCSARRAVGSETGSSKVGNVQDGARFEEQGW